jgi:hypothetical protein
MRFRSHFVIFKGFAGRKISPFSLLDAQRAMIRPGRAVLDPAERIDIAA